MVVAMDALALNLKTGCLSPVAARNPRLTATWRLSTRVAGQWTGRSRKARSLGLAVVCASGKKKSNGPPSSGDDQEIPKTSHEKSEPFESESYHTVSDWRDFRANLVAREKDILLKAEQQPESGANPTESPSILKGRQMNPVWAHQTIPEKGCLLIATEEIDRDDNFQRSVILLISLGSEDPRNYHGPIGLILNRPLDKKVKEIDTMHSSLKSNFGNHQLHFGGPLQYSDVSMFLVKTGGHLKTGGSVNGIAHQSGLQEVVSGVHFGGARRSEEAAALVRGGVLEPSDFKFFAGYACWGSDQLLNEIEMGYWVVAACSSNVIGRAITGTSDQMWQEVLEIMGGRYADLSRKARLDEPKQD